VLKVALRNSSHGTVPFAFVAPRKGSADGVLTLDELSSGSLNNRDLKQLSDLTVGKQREAFRRG